VGRLLEPVGFPRVGQELYLASDVGEGAMQGLVPRTSGVGDAVAVRGEGDTAGLGKRDQLEGGGVDGGGRGCGRRCDEEEGEERCSGVRDRGRAS
jgi:hypothetical protein